MKRRGVLVQESPADCGKRPCTPRQAVPYYQPKPRSSVAAPSRSNRRAQAAARGNRRPDPRRGEKLALSALLLPVVALFGLNLAISLLRPIDTSKGLDSAADHGSREASAITAANPPATTKATAEPALPKSNELAFIVPPVPAKLRLAPLPQGTIPAPRLAYPLALNVPERLLPPLPKLASAAPYPPATKLPRITELAYIIPPPPVRAPRYGAEIVLLPRKAYPLVLKLPEHLLPPLPKLASAAPYPPVIKLPPINELAYLVPPPPARGPQPRPTVAAIPRRAYPTALNLPERLLPPLPRLVSAAPYPPVTRLPRTEALANALPPLPVRAPRETSRIAALPHIPQSAGRSVPRHLPPPPVRRPPQLRRAQPPQPAPQLAKLQAPLTLQAPLMSQAPIEYPAAPRGAGAEAANLCHYRNLEPRYPNMAKIATPAPAQIGQNIAPVSFAAEGPSSWPVDVSAEGRSPLILASNEGADPYKSQLHLERAFGRQLAAAAKLQMRDFTYYNPSYVKLSYPMGDVPPVYGVCSDVIVRAYRHMGFDLQELVHRARIGSGDRNIDHRRTRVLQKFFQRYGDSLPITDYPEDYKAGDIVSYYRPHGRTSKWHIAIVSDQIAPSGYPYVLHNRAWGVQKEDALFSDKITGHYRFSTLRRVIPGIAPRSPRKLLAQLPRHSAKPTATAVLFTASAGALRPAPSRTGRKKEPPGKNRGAIRSASTNVTTSRRKLREQRGRGRLSLCSPFQPKWIKKKIAHLCSPFARKAMGLGRGRNR